MKRKLYKAPKSASPPQRKILRTQEVLKKTMKHYLEHPVTAICIKLVVIFNVCYLVLQ